MIAPRGTPYIDGSDIGTTYVALLESRLYNLSPYDYHVVHISDPVSSIEFEEFTVEGDEWIEIINAGEVLTPFENFEFHDGTTGRYWVETRIRELFSGVYANRLTTPHNQLQMITDRLQQGNHGQTTNALTAQVFQIDPDLEKATEGRPLAPGIPCLTFLQFKPQRDKLHLYATFRSQYLDSKCFGNLISLALLLADMCRQTGYEPGYMVEIAHNSIFWNSTDAERLYSALTESSSKINKSVADPP